MKKSLFASSCFAVATVGVMYFAAPAMANTGRLYLVISGTQSANTSYVLKNTDNQNGTVYISGTTAGDANMWAQMYNSEKVPRSDTVFVTYRSITPITNNVGLANYAYYLNCRRQYWWDSPQTFDGWWSPDQV